MKQIGGCPQRQPKVLVAIVQGIRSMKQCEDYDAPLYIQNAKIPAASGEIE
jgi:hypothetical protein